MWREAVKYKAAHAVIKTIYNNFLSFWRHAKTKKLSDLLVLKGRIYMAEIIQIYYTNADIYSLCVFDFV